MLWVCCQNQDEYFNLYLYTIQLFKFMTMSVGQVSIQSLIKQCNAMQCKVQLLKYTNYDTSAFIFVNNARHIKYI